MTIVGSPHVMSMQIRHILDVGARDNVSIRILPREAGYPGGNAIAPYIIVETADEPQIAYAESAIGSMLFEDEEDIQRYRGVHDTLREAALDETPTRDRLRRIAREYER